MDTINIQMYGMKPFPRELRLTFQLFSDPYDIGEDNKTIGYLRDLGVVFYRDDRFGIGVIIEPDDGNEMLMRDRSGWMCYSNMCIIDKQTGRVISWPMPNFRNKPALIQRDKKVAKEGDDKAWLVFNKIGTMMDMDESRVISV